MFGGNAVICRIQNQYLWSLILTPFRMEGGGGGPTSFSPITSTNVRISSKNFLTFTFDIFTTPVYNFKGIPSPSPSYWIWTKTTPQKSNKFSHRNARVTKLWSHWPHLHHNLRYVIKFCWWLYGQKLWSHNLYFKIPFFEEGLE